MRREHGTSEPRWLSWAGPWLVFVALVVLRFPDIRSTRPYAEEGTTYLTNALENGAWDALFDAFAGYLALFANVTGVIQAAVPAELIPAVSVLAGLVGPVTVAALMRRADLTRWGYVAALAVIVFTNTMTREWYSPIHTQFWLALAVVLLIAVPGSTRRQRAADVIVCLAAGLSGTVVSAVLPALLLVAWRRRSSHFAVLSGVLALTTVIQFVLAGASRSVTVPIGRMPQLVFIRVFWYPLVGRSGQPAAESMWNLDGYLGALVFAALVLTLIIGLTLLTAGPWRAVMFASLWVSSAGLYFSLPPVEAFLDFWAGSRYLLVGVVGSALSVVVSTAQRLSRRPPERNVLVTSGVAVISVLAIQGAVTGLELAAAEPRTAWDDDVRQFGLDPGLTIAIDPPGSDCLVSLNRSDQQQGFAASLSPSTLEVVVGVLDRGRPVEVYLLAVSTTNPRRYWGLDGDASWREFVPSVFGGAVTDEVGLGRCRLPGSPTPVPLLRSTTSRLLLQVTQGLRDSRPNDTMLLVGYGRSFEDSLAKGTWAVVEP